MTRLPIQLYHRQRTLAGSRVFQRECQIWIPVSTTLPLAPDATIHLGRCKYVKERYRTNHCQCRKAGLKCIGDECEVLDDDDDDDNNDDDDDDEMIRTNLMENLSNCYINAALNLYGQSEHQNKILRSDCKPVLVHVCFMREFNFVQRIPGHFSSILIQSFLEQIATT